MEEGGKDVEDVDGCEEDDGAGVAVMMDVPDLEQGAELRESRATIDTPDRQAHPKHTLRTSRSGS
eukprot:474486-Rhodomonas_salina.1